MKKVLLKLQDLKIVFRKLRNTYGCLDKKVCSLKEELDVAQLACDLDPFNVALKEDIAHILLAYQQARNDQLELARQKAKVKWYVCGWHVTTDCPPKIVLYSGSRNRLI